MNRKLIVELWHDWIQTAHRKFTPEKTQCRTSVPPWTSEDTSNEVLRQRTIQRRLEFTTAFNRWKMLPKKCSSTLETIETSKKDVIKLLFVKI